MEKEKKITRSICLKPSHWEQLKKEAEKENRSLNNYIEVKLKE